MDRNSQARNACTDAVDAFNSCGLLIRLTVCRQSHTPWLALSLFFVACVVALGLWSQTAAADDIDYVYDELGRLVQTSNRTAGQAVLYTYDAAGNIASQSSTSLATLSIGHFTPRIGPTGTQITIYGAGFDPAPAGNVVRFNGVTAAVVSANQTQIVATVPASATTGPISVEVGVSTVVSNTPFTVTTANDAPTITAVLPNAGAVGHPVTIVGTNFEPVPEQNRVRFGNAPAHVILATTTTISTRVPPNAGSGPIRVTTPRGNAVSASDFVVLPSGYSTSQIVSSQRMTSDGVATTLTFASIFKIGLRMFDGVAGELLAIGVTATSLGSTTIKVYGPDGQQLVSGTVSATGQGLQLPKLPTTGTYTILVDCGSSTGSISLGVFKPLQSSLAVGGAPTTVNLAPPGRRALLTFSGTQGSYLSVSLSAVTLSAGTLSVLTPTGAVLSSATFNTSGVTTQPLLPRTGTYVVLLDPSGSVGGSVTVSAAASTSPTLTPDGSDYVLDLTNQTPITLTFRSTAGQYMSLAALTSTTNLQGTTITVRNPDGSQRATASVTTGTPSGGGYAGSALLNFGPLQPGGTYTIVVQKAAGGSGSLILTLTSALAGTISPDGATSNVVISRPGQGVLRTFAGTAGQYLSFALAESSGSICGATITVVKPDGSTLTTGTFTPTFTTSGGSNGYVGGSVLSMAPLPVSGTYRILVQQKSSTRVGDNYTGPLSLTLSMPLTGTLTADGTTTSIPVPHTGQGLLYTFTGSADQYLSLAISETGGSINALTVTVLDPQGAAIAAGSMITTTSGSGGGGFVGIYGSAVVNMGPLPMSGTYTVLVMQAATTVDSIGTLDLTLSSPLTGSLPANASQLEIPISIPGQGLLHTFAGTAGQHAAFRLGGAGGWITAATVTVLAPDGASLATANMTTTPNVVLGAVQGYSGSVVINLGPLATTGTYSVLVQQTGSGRPNIGTLTSRLSPPLTGTLSADGTTNLVEIVNAGRGLLYTFAAGVGDYRALAVTESGGRIKSAAVSILNPDGSTLVSGNLTTTASFGSGEPTYTGGMVMNVGPVVTAGTYTVLLRQTGSGTTETGTLSLTLSQPVQGSVPLGTPASVSITTPGQGLLQSFSGTAGQHLSVRVSEGSGSYISGAAIKVINPNGALLKVGTLTTSPCSGCGYTGTATLGTGPLPSSGTHHVLVQQTTLAGAGTGTLSLELTDLQLGPDITSNISTTTPGQAANVTFSAVIGQSVSVALSGVTVTPSATVLYSMNVYRPDGANMLGVSCWSNQPGCVAALRNLPMTGTYRVEITPQSAHTISGTITISQALTGTLTPDVPFAANLSALGQAAHLSFAAVAGQAFSVNLGALSTTPANTTATVQVYNSSGTQIATGTTQTGLTLSPSNLATDTYSVWIWPQHAATSTMQITLKPTVAPPNATPTSVSTPHIGQKIYSNFSAQAGQSVSVALSSVALVPSTTGLYSLNVYRPDGLNILGVSCWSNQPGCEAALRNLPATGTYRVEIVPPATQTMSGTLTISQALTGTLTPEVPFTANLSALGQGAYLSFTAAAGQAFSMNLGALSTTPANTAVTMQVHNAAGMQIATGSTQTGLSLSLSNLAAGTYSVWVWPQSPATSTMQITLKPTVAPPNATPTSFSTPHIGQKLYFNFDAQVGNSFGVALSSVALVPTTTGLYSLNVYRPDGLNILSVSCWSNQPGCEVAPRNLPATGTYRVEIVPPATQTMSGTITISQALTGTLTPDVPFAANLSAMGQPADLTFTAVAGQAFSVNLGALSTAPVNTSVTMQVYNSYGGLLRSGSTSTGLSLDLSNLPVDTYSVWIAPQSPMTGTMQVELKPILTPPNGIQTSFSTPYIGQKAYSNFSAQAGQSVSVALSSVALVPSTTGLYSLNVYRPDGLNILGVSCWSNQPGCEAALRNLPATGTYRVEIVPPATQTMSGTLTISQALTGTLTPEVPFTANLSALGQGAYLSFTAAAGQAFSMNLGALSTTPANTAVTMQVHNAAGTQIATGSTQTGLSLSLSNLAAGTYSVWVWPQSPATSTMEIMLKPTTMLADATPTSFSTPYIGQKANFSFSAAAGQGVGIALTGASLTPSATGLYTVNVYRPDGLNILSVSCWSNQPGCEVAPRNLPATGTYRVEIVPPATQTMSGTITASQPLAATLSAGTPQNISLTPAGRPAALGFTLASAQSVALSVTSISSVPANTTIYINAYNSAGIVVASGTATTSTTLNIASLAAGNYTVWIYPQYPATSSMTVGY